MFVCDVTGTGLAGVQYRGSSIREQAINRRRWAPYGGENDNNEDTMCSGRNVRRYRFVIHGGL